MWGGTLLHQTTQRLPRILGSVCTSSVRGLMRLVPQACQADCCMQPPCQADCDPRFGL